MGRPKYSFLLSLLLLAGCQIPYDPTFDYLSILAASPQWDQTSDPSFPGFTYEPAVSPELTALDRRWGISATAGTGTSYRRMCRLMAWVNDVTTQEGSAAPPSPKTADHFLELSTNGSGAKLNCLATAITFSEVLLAAGIPARTLTMYPAQQTGDVHVVVVAWSPEYAKWVYLDPSYNASFVGADNMPLSPLEVRDALRAGDEPQVSAGSGWNGGAFDLNYLHYLSKNLYMFSSNAQSTVGYEDLGFSRVKVFLTPTGVDPPWIWNASVRNTHSPADFFAPPK